MSNPLACTSARSVHHPHHPLFTPILSLSFSLSSFNLSPTPSNYPCCSFLLHKENMSVSVSSNSRNIFFFWIQISPFSWAVPIYLQPCISTTKKKTEVYVTPHWHMSEVFWQSVFGHGRAALSPLLKVAAQHQDAFIQLHKPLPLKHTGHSKCMVLDGICSFY